MEKTETCSVEQVSVCLYFVLPLVLIYDHPQRTIASVESTLSSGRRDSGALVSLV